MSSDSKRRSTEAAGGLLWRGDGSQISVALVHRARYDDWSLPKGKPKVGELRVHTAVREVTEETGARVSVSRRLGRTRYQVDGIDKVVRFWAMQYVDGEFAASDEVDELVWLDLSDARRRLTYPSEQLILDALSPAPPTSTVVLVRHAKAGKRSDWDGPDELRPLERAGRAQAKAVAQLVPLFAPVRILSADPVRCVQTVTPLAARLQQPIEIDASFSDHSFEVDPSKTFASLDAITAGYRSTVIASQGITIDGIVSRFAGNVVTDPPTKIGSSTSKGATWVLSCRNGQIVSADYYRASTYRSV